MSLCRSVFHLIRFFREECFKTVWYQWYMLPFLRKKQREVPCVSSRWNGHLRSLNWYQIDKTSCRISTGDVFQPCNERSRSRLFFLTAYKDGRILIMLQSLSLQHWKYYELKSTLLLHLWGLQVRASREYFTDTETSLLPVKNYNRSHLVVMVL